MGTVLGKYLRQLRATRGLGIKRVAPELGLSYTSLSKFENGKVEPSQNTLDRIARYYSVDSSQLALRAGRVPADLRKILEEHPDEAIKLLRARFGR